MKTTLKAKNKWSAESCEPRATVKTTTEIDLWEILENFGKYIVIQLYYLWKHMAKPFDLTFISVLTS